MSRLFYPPKLTDAKLSSGETSENTVEIYAEKVIKMVPVEIVGGYLALVGLTPAVQDATLRRPLVFVAFLLCLVLTPLYLNFLAEQGKPKRTQLILSTIAFVIWAYVASGNALIPEVYDPPIGSFLMIVFTLVSGIIPIQS